LIEIVFSPRLSFASTSNATTVSTDVPPFDSATDGGDLSASVLVVDVDSPHAPAITTTRAVIAARETTRPRLFI
jgi:hypothetical protein